MADIGERLGRYRRAFQSLSPSSRRTVIGVAVGIAVLLLFVLFLATRDDPNTITQAELEDRLPLIHDDEFGTEPLEVSCPEGDLHAGESTTCRGDFVDGVEDIEVIARSGPDGLEIEILNIYQVD